MLGREKSSAPLPQKSTDALKKSQSQIWPQLHCKSMLLLGVLRLPVNREAKAPDAGHAGLRMPQLLSRT